MPHATNEVRQAALWTGEGEIYLPCPIVCDSHVYVYALTKQFTRRLRRKFTIHSSIKSSSSRQ